MKIILGFLLCTVAPIYCQAQFKEGFSKQEVRDMVAITNSFTFIDIYNSDEEIIPDGYEKEYTSGVFGMDNRYQIYTREDFAIINLRGSTDKKVSWLENFYSAMIPAKGVITISGGASALLLCQRYQALQFTVAMHWQLPF